MNILAGGHALANRRREIEFRACQGQIDKRARGLDSWPRLPCREVASMHGALEAVGDEPGFRSLHRGRPEAACMLENGYMFLKYVLSQGLGELAAGNDSRNEPQSNALLRTTLRLLITRPSPRAGDLHRPAGHISLHSAVEQPLARRPTFCSAPVPSPGPTCPPSPRRCDKSRAC